jgi:zinc/manganese transport system substrate-binding protein
MNNSMYGLAAALLLAGLPAQPAAAADKLQVVCTLPHLASLAREVGGDRVDVTALASGQVNPHFVAPTPRLMAATSEADLFVEVGANLELWTERVLDGARNPAVRWGQPGHVFASTGVEFIQRPVVVSRQQGDVHPQGNPHVWLNPHNAVLMARNIAEGLKRVDPEAAGTYAANLERFEARVAGAYFGAELVTLLGHELLWRLQRTGRLFSFLEERRYKGAPLAERAGGWLGRMWPHRGAAFVSFHQIWGYFAVAFDLAEVGQLEPKPGIPPTPGHLAELEERSKARGVTVVVCAPFYDLAKAESFAERVGAGATGFPTEPEAPIAGWFDLMDELTKRFARAAAGASRGDDE